jgi:hypothetical protein
MSIASDSLLTGQVDPNPPCPFDSAQQEATAREIRDASGLILDVSKIVASYALACPPLLVYKWTDPVAHLRWTLSSGCGCSKTTRARWFRLFSGPDTTHPHGRYDFTMVLERTPAGRWQHQAPCWDAIKLAPRRPEPHGTGMVVDVLAHDGQFWVLKAGVEGPAFVYDAVRRLLKNAIG